MLVGYKLIQDIDGATIQQWGGSFGTVPELPNPLRLPNGDCVHGPSLDLSMNGYTLIHWYEDKPITASDVRVEASRRMQVAFAARDADHLDKIISNATREVARLNQIKFGVPHPTTGWLVEPRDWTASERIRLAQLHAADMLLESIRAASNVMESSPPANYEDNQWWPGV